MTILPEEQEVPPPPDPVAGLFTAMLRNGLRSTLAEVQQAVALLPEEVRQRAWHLLSYALRTGEAWPETRDLLLLLAPKMEQAGFREEWIAYLTSGVAVGQQHNDATAAAEFALQIATLYRMIAEYERAVQWLAVSLGDFHQLGAKQGEARALNEWAWIEQLRRRYDDASRHVAQALTLLDEDDPERGMCYRVQGMIAIAQGRWQEAETHHRAALCSFDEQSDLRKKAWTLVNIGIALNGQSRFEDAIEFCSDAATILEQLGDEQNLIVAQINLGAAYYFSQKIRDAIPYYVRAEELALRVNDRYRLAEIYLNLGLAHMADGSPELASNAFQNSVQLFEQLGVKSKTINSMDGLAMSFIAQNRHDRALSVIEKAISMLPEVVTDPGYACYQQSLNKHREEAKAGLTACTEVEIDVRAL